VPSRPLEDTLYELPEVTLAVVFGVKAAAGGAESAERARRGREVSGGLPPDLDRDGEVAVAAVVLREGASLDGAALFAALSARHPPSGLPRLVRIVPALPMTEGFRPLKADLRAEGLAPAGASLRLDVSRATYLP
jgi:acyl-CoA synthetase (AMP-forming)/AMP-acid ligase II